MLKEIKLLIFLVIIFAVCPHLDFGFKLRDTASTTADDNEDRGAVAGGGGPRGESVKTIPFRKIARIVHVNDDGTESEEEVAVNFEKVHKARISIQPDTKTQRSQRSNRNLDKTDDDDDNENDDDEEEEEEEEAEGEKEDDNDDDDIDSNSDQVDGGSDVSEDDIDKSKKLSDSKNRKKVISKQEQQTSFLSGILNTIGFGGAEKNSKKSKEDSNGIINWFKTFTQQKEIKTLKNEPRDTQKDEAIAESWMSYLDRWPFKMVLKFLNYESDVSETSDGSSTTDSPELRPDTKSSEPMSWETFEQLLYNMPAFVVNASTVQNSDCRTQLKIFYRQLRGHKMWALQMLDSSAKISTGLLRGNIKHFGDFDLCTRIKAHVKVTEADTVRIRGKYCLAHLDIVATEESMKVPVYYMHGRNVFKSSLKSPFNFAPRYSIANLGICLPNSCDSDIVAEMLEMNLKSYNSTGINIHIYISEKDCHVRQNQDIFHQFAKNWKFRISALICVSAIVIVLTATAFDYWTMFKQISSDYLKAILKDVESEKDAAAAVTNDNWKGADQTKAAESTEEGETTANLKNVQTSFKNQEDSPKTLLKNALLSFSLKQTIPEMVKQNPDEDIGLLNLLKIISTFLVYVCLKFIMLGHLPLINRDSFVKAITNPMSALIRSPLLYFDTFLLISGVLASYRICGNKPNGKSSFFLRRFAVKTIRYFPTLIILLCIQNWILPHFGSGPLWGSLIQHNTELCEKHMWRNLLHLQNTIKIEDTCSPVTVQFAVDFQLFFLAPIMLWLYASNEELGLLVYGSAHAISVASRYSRTIQDRLSATIFHGMNINQFYRTANVLYASPMHRMTPYLTGIGLGIILRKLEKPAPPIPMGTLFSGWISAVWCLAWCFYYSWLASSTEYVYDPKDAAVFASWSPLLISLSVSWIIFVSYTFNDQKLRFLSSKVLIFLGKISFPLQFISYIVVMYFTAQSKDSEVFDVSSIINVKELTLSIVIASVVAIFIDLPMQNVRKQILQFESRRDIQTEFMHPTNEEVHKEIGEEKPKNTEEHLEEEIDVFSKKNIDELDSEKSREWANPSDIIMSDRFYSDDREMKEIYDNPHHIEDLLEPSGEADEYVLQFEFSNLNDIKEEAHEDDIDEDELGEEEELEEDGLDGEYEEDEEEDDDSKQKEDKVSTL